MLMNPRLCYTLAAALSLTALVAPATLGAVSSYSLRARREQVRLGWSPSTLRLTSTRETDRFFGPGVLR